MSFQNPTHECDIIMKGGVTSGVVYPKVLLRLAPKYRFRSVGGTSAGAIAAALAAAAEYNRLGGGFERLAEIPNELAGVLFTLFQPVPQHKKTYHALLKASEKKDVGLIWALWNARKLISSFKALPKTRYGMCPGLRQPGYAEPGLTDWLYEKMQYVAGLPLDRPLNFGDLKAKGIKLRMITTNLSKQSPLTLPLDQTFWMDPADAAALMPKPVSDQLRETTGEDGLFAVPSGDDMPVLLATRMSLSFPGLLAAVPLYCKDYTLRLCDDQKEIKRVSWFSDGGISSNFPVHLFDSPLPTRPTFGISLGAFHECRQTEDDGVPGRNRIYLPKEAGRGQLRPMFPISGTMSFLGAILDSARNWQDASQAILPGYTERIVRIYLKGDEGGLRLEMGKELIDALGELGGYAGDELLSFDFDEHRWRRLLAATAAMEKYFEALRGAFDPSFQNFLDDYVTKFEMNGPTGSYKPANAAKLKELKGRWEELAALGKRWAEAPLRDAWGENNGSMPKPRATVRFTPAEFTEPEKE